MRTLHKCLFSVFLFFFVPLFQLSAQPVALNTQKHPSDNLLAISQYKSRPVLDLRMPLKNQGSKHWTNRPGMGALVGFVVGGTYGALLGTFGKEWVLHDGMIVPRPVHAVVDLFIVAVPTTTIGLIVGLRQERSTLETSKIHVAIAGGWTSAMTYKTMLNAYDISGLPRHIPHWFGYLHYPDGGNSSNPYTWNLSADYNLMKHISIGAAFNNIVKQQIAGGIDDHHPTEDREFATGESYGLFGDYIINPITPENKTRLEFSAGAGVGLQNLKAGGFLGATQYAAQKYSVAPQFRATADYYSRKYLSLQLKFGYRSKQTLTIPEQIDGARTLVAHSISFMAVDITLGVRYHFNHF